MDSLTAFFERWAPPGGWIVAALVLFTLSTSAGVIFPMSPAGLLLQSLVGSLGAPLVPAWCGWIAWLLIRRRRPSAWRAASLLALSATWLVALALRQPQGGGLLGETLLSLLDAGFGRSGGLAIVSIAAAASLVNVVGLERILDWAATLARFGPHGAARLSRPGPAPPPAEPVGTLDSSR